MSRQSACRQRWVAAAWAFVRGREGGRGAERGRSRGSRPSKSWIGQVPNVPWPNVIGILLSWTSRLNSNRPFVTNCWNRVAWKETCAALTVKTILPAVMPSPWPDRKTPAKVESACASPVVGSRQTSEKRSGRGGSFHRLARCRKRRRSSARVPTTHKERPDGSGTPWPANIGVFGTVW